MAGLQSLIRHIAGNTTLRVPTAGAMVLLAVQAHHLATNQEQVVALLAVV
jgi:hypothetical protein